MRKLFEIDINEDFKSAIISQYFLMIFTFLVIITGRMHERSFFQISFLVEIVLAALTFKFLFQAQKQRNYAYWGITIIVGIYLFVNLLHYTFIDYNILNLYVVFISSFFLLLNSYIMSSPLFFPRVQWWEWDFRYRGDLKALIKYNDKIIESRLTDLRRHAGCIEAFEYISLDTEVMLEVVFEDDIYEIPCSIKTNKQVIPGRPMRYGVKFNLLNELNKINLSKLSKVWSENKKVKLRRKFADDKGLNELL